MCRQGWLGQKAGVGFYRHVGKKRKPYVEVQSVLRREGIAASAKLTPDEERRHARDRLVLRMVNEAAACLGEAPAASAEVIDLAMVLGTGWAPHRGGPLRYADDRGLADVVSV